ncbi:MarR family winged helix-turn-helix transcriptional regulator [Chelatococcus sp. GCM10030263]|uniref:MarR family winged helix-turn-helix transcriptional regulator n=1 Tax=Chelatococcus sp. GCM10030263 TaxID=3273387 RepID=UPI00360C60FC
MNSKLNDPARTPPPSLGFLLHDVARLLRKRFEQHTRDRGLTRSQWQVLAYLEKNEGTHQAGLAELLEVEPITLARMVDKLEALGLVERRPHATDRRIWLLFLTPQAGPRLDEMHETAALVREEAFEDLSERDRATLLKLLGRLKGNLARALNERPVQRRENHG